MDMDMGMDMSGMDMSGGSVDPTWIAQVYWIFIGSIVAFFSLTNLVDYILFRQR
jgi:hypothetical protein